MSRPVVTGSSQGNHTGTVLTLSGHVSDGNPLYVVVCTSGGGVYSTSVTYGGVALTLRMARTVAAGSFYPCEVWTLASPAAGTADVVVTHAEFRNRTAGALNISGGPSDGAIQILTSQAQFVNVASALIVPAYGTNSLALGLTVSVATSTATDTSTVVWSQSSGPCRSACGTYPGGALATYAWSHGAAESANFGFAVADGATRLTGGTCQLWLSRLQQPGGNGSAYGSLPTAREFTASFSDDGTPLLSAGTLHSLTFGLDVAPGLGKSQILTVYRNEVATALTATISDTATRATLSAEVPWYPYDRVVLQRSGTGAPASGLMDYCLEAETATSGVSLYGSGHADHGATTGITKYQGALFPMSTWATPVTWRNNLCASTGVLDTYLVQLPYLLRAGDTVTFHLVLNGVVQDGTAGTVDTELVISFAAGEDRPTYQKAVALPLALADQLYVRGVTTAISGSDIIRPAIGARLTATTRGEYTIGGGVHNLDLGSIITRWGPVTDDDLLSDTETVQRITIAPLTATQAVTGIVARIATAAGVGASWAFSNRQNLSSPSGITTLTLADLDVAGIAAGDLAYVEGDTIDMQFVPVSSPATPGAAIWALRGYSVTPTVTRVYPLRRLRRFALPFADNKYIFLKRLEILAQMGVGLTEGDAADPPVQGSDPQLMIRISKDGGKTWGTEFWVPLGKIGDYARRAFAHRLGRGRNLVVEITDSDPVYSALIDAFAEFEVGTS